MREELFQWGSIYFDVLLKFEFWEVQIFRNIETGENQILGIKFFMTGLSLKIEPH